MTDAARNSSCVHPRAISVTTDLPCLYRTSYFWPIWEIKETETILVKMPISGIIFALQIGSFCDLSARNVCEYKCIVGVIWKASHNFMLQIPSDYRPSIGTTHKVVRSQAGRLWCHWPVLFQVLVTSPGHTSAPGLPTPHIFFSTLILRTSFCKSWCPKRQLGALALGWDWLSWPLLCYDLEQVL